METTDESSMPLWEHLDELRGCLIRSLVAVILGAIVVYQFIEPVMLFLERPLLRVLPPGNTQLYFTGIAEKFLVYLKVCILGSLGLTSPYILNQAWRFFSPGLYDEERKFLLPFIVFGSVAFLVGLAFSYYIVIPYGYEFLIQFGSPNDKPMITLTEYFSLTLQLLLGVGLIFEVPVILGVLARMGVVDVGMLKKFRKYAVVANAVVAGIITPSPDAFTMVIVWVPLMVLYEIAIVVVRWAGK